MKKFNEWRDSLEENMNAAALKNTLGGASVKVDPILRSKLRTKILQVVADFPDKNPAELFQEIIAVVGSLMTQGSGGTASASKMFKQLNQPLGQTPAQQQQQAQQSQQMQNNQK